MKVDDLLGNSHEPGLPGLRRGVFPYFGGGASVCDVRRAVEVCGGAVAAGKGGAAIARKVDDVWADPGVYTTFASGAPEARPDPDGRFDEGLFDLDERL